MKTNHTSTSVPRRLLTSWQRLVVNRSQPYALQQADGTYRWVYEACTPQLLGAHLAGEITLALSCTGEAGQCRWLCLDADQADALPQMVALAGALAERGLPGLVESSRRGGHLWLLLDGPVLAAAVRRVALDTLDALRRGGSALPALEVYPDAAAAVAGTLGHAVRLPLGIHRLTGRRYPLFDAGGHPCAFTSTEAALRFVLDWPRIAAVEIIRRTHELSPPRAATPLEPTTVLTTESDASHTLSTPRSQIGTRSPVIRWVDAEISPLELLADLAPESAMRPVGRGYLGWCPFHDDQAPDAAGRPGTPSFYVVHDRLHGWSWRCFSTNCPQSWGPMRHSFELLQRLLGLTVRSAIVEACTRWPEADTHGSAMFTTSSHDTEAADAR
jgi:hypothetical protein